MQWHAVAARCPSLCVLTCVGNEILSGIGRQHLPVNVVVVDANVDATLTPSSTSENKFTTADPSTIQTQYRNAAFRRVFVQIFENVLNQHFLTLCD